MKLTENAEIGDWPDHELAQLEALGFVPMGRLDDGVNNVAVLTHPAPPTYALLYAGTPYVEFHSLHPRGYGSVTTDAPSRVDEFGEHEGRRDRPEGTTLHRLLEPAALFGVHKALVEELSPSRGSAQPTKGLEGARRRLEALVGRSSWRDIQSLATLALVFVSTIALAAAALSFFGE
ncbi:MAG: hypothetical protein AAF627_08920 [Myxococcota bacterium]